MFRIQRIVITLECLLVVSLAGCQARSGARLFENESFSFTIPVGWKTVDEVWGRPASSGQEYYGLGVQQVVMIQFPPEQRQGKVFFAVASYRMADGQDLESLFANAYQTAVPEIVNESKQPFGQGDLKGYEITYKRPWGEPWWQFRDVWLEKDQVVFVLSLHASPDSFDSYTDTFDQIVGSFRFKD